ncbi:MAG: excinuclease ABC subunit UvrC [Candidatus Omnitrophica bacterium]|nr:excinuclease ABC subunit UvrC [Candidatus Omnitrophota bacterium]
MSLKETILKIPLVCGVYLMKSKQRQVIYVGKAVNLRRRVQSYFKENHPDPKTGKLAADISYVDFIETSSEAEALILEASLIKKYAPKYNIDLRDDKSFPYIEITGDEFPRIFLSRPRKKNKTSKYFGPYTEPRLAREALSLIRKIFHFRSCKALPGKVCLDHHLGLCDGPCEGKVSKEEYKMIVKKISLILEGKKDDLYRGLSKEMDKAAQNEDFELAAKARNQMLALGALYSGAKDMNYYKEAEQLKMVLGLKNSPLRIEAFDISNTMGAQSAGSMVSFFNGKPDKSNYRRFRIRETEGIDDYKMISEVVRRRYKRVKEEKGLLPDLIVIDGGKGQLSAAQKELAALELNVPMVSLAKQEEEIYLPNKSRPVKMPPDSLGLQLLQRVRDEAHRFALGYHRKLRSKNVFKIGV